MDATAVRARCSSRAVQTFVCHKLAVQKYFFRRLSRSREDAADLTQEVGFRFLSLKPQFWPDDPRRYLFGIARHVLAEHLEGRARQLKVDEAIRLEQQLGLSGSADVMVSVGVCAPA